MKKDLGCEVEVNVGGGDQLGRGEGDMAVIDRALGKLKNEPILITYVILRKKSAKSLL